MAAVALGPASRPETKSSLPAASSPKLTNISPTLGYDANAIFRKELPVVRIGRNVRLDRRGLDRIIDECKM